MISYLIEYTAPHPFQSPENLRARMTNATNCSSLEAISWGLEYNDFVNFLFSFWPAPGLGLPGQTNPSLPKGLDRSWALEQAMNRNQRDQGCGTDSLASPDMSGPGQLTLERSAEMLLEGQMPAFTLNTTAAETGGRFLLANYQLPVQGDPHSDMMYAESFLHAFAYPDEWPQLHHSYADLSLATGARLSAAFPIVSSASRLPKTFADHTYHFVDGGYYDNDGTASAIEFLYEALLSHTEQVKVPILLIEIRDGVDLDATHTFDEFAQQDGYQYKKGKWIPQKSAPEDWRADHQMTAPLEALWNAGHVSVTRRNRRELCLLEEDYRDKMRVHHLVFDYPDEPNQPLNWHLTSVEQQRIRKAAASAHITAAESDALRWVKRVLTTGLDQEDDRAVCHVVQPEPSMP